MDTTLTKHEHVGSFDKSQIATLMQEIQRQKAARRDYIYPASALSMDDDGQLVFAATDTFRVGELTYTEWKDAEAAADAMMAADNGVSVPVVPLGKTGALPLTKTAEQQLAGRLGIPMKYINGLRNPTRDGKQSTGELEAAIAAKKKLAAHNFRELLGVDHRRFLVRTLDGQARAVMSDRYRVLDNGDLFFASFEAFKANNAEIWHGRLWGDGFQMLGVAAGIAGKVSTDRTFDPGDGWQSRWYGTEGDVHNAAVSIRNSETGQGGLSIKPSIMRRVCANFNVWADGYGAFHIGGKRQGEGLLQHLGLGDAGDGMIMSEATQAAESKVIWLKVKDVITTAFNPERFQLYIDRLNGATRQVLAKPEKAVENVVAEFEISDDRAKQILAELLRIGDRTRSGLAQAVTYTAHQADQDGRPDEASDLESLGGELVEMDDKRFSVLGDLVTA